jgi:formylglycine-generating enzyme required for sulfatase activity
LARVADPRRGVGLRQDGLPDFQWVRIPGTGTVQVSDHFPHFTGLKLGNGVRSDPEAHNDENWPASAEPLELQNFELAAYPVTVAQFRLFVEQGGYQEERYWSKPGWRYRNEGDRWRQGEVKAPYAWDDPTWTLANHPVIGVSWYEAEAYCNWLNEQLQLPRGTLRLPTEAEWEWAARGPEGRRYPWGDDWESCRCNSSESGVNRTNAVGCFPGGAEDYWWKEILPDSEAVQDLAGNVWEWTASAYRKDYATAHESVLNTDHSVDSPCVQRGGSWGDDSKWLRGAARYSRSPHGRYRDRGFRLARTFP